MTVMGAPVFPPPVSHCGQTHGGHGKERASDSGVDRLGYGEVDAEREQGNADTDRTLGKNAKSERAKGLNLGRGARHVLTPYHTKFDFVREIHALSRRSENFQIGQSKVPLDRMAGAWQGKQMLCTASPSGWPSVN
jgi:hypothetical protein